MNYLLQGRITELTNRISVQYHAIVEHLLVETIEAQLGRVPSDKEVATRGEHLVNWPEQGTDTYLFNGVVLFAIRQFYRDGKWIVEVKRP